MARKAFNLKFLITEVTDWFELKARLQVQPGALFHLNRPRQSPKNMDKKAPPKSIKLPETIKVFRNLKKAKRFAIDIGGSLTKIAYFSTMSYRRANYCSIHKDMTSLDDHYYEVSEHARLHFVKFETKYIEHCLDFIKSNLVGSKESMMGKIIKATGGGAYKYANTIQEKLGLKVEKEDEMSCLVKGCNFLLKNISDEAFTFHRHANPEYEFQTTDQNIFPYMLVNIGSGVSILKVESEDCYERIGGTATGGGTFWGLGTLLTKATEFDELLELAEVGDHRNTDMLVKDIYGADYKAHGLNSELIASAFGKICQSVKKGQTITCTDADVVRSLLFTISNDIGQIASLYAMMHNLNKVYFGGYFLRNHPLSMHTVSFSINYWSKGKVQSLFLRHEGYLGAIGAFLKGTEECGENYSWQENYAGSSALEPQPAIWMDSMEKSRNIAQLELDREVQRKFCPLLLNTAHYVPDTMDLIIDHEARVYWLDCFEESIRKFADAAIKSQPESKTAVERANQFKEKFLRRLQKLRLHPFAYGNLTVRCLLETIQHCMKEFDFPDPYLLVKQNENEAALAQLQDRLQHLDKLPLKELEHELVLGLLAGNMFDWGAQAIVDIMGKEKFGLAEARSKIPGRPWVIDHLDMWLNRLRGPPHSKAAIFIDNSGVDIVLGVLPFARFLLSRGTKVILCANSGPAINDVTFKELEVILTNAGSICPVLKKATEEKRLVPMETAQNGPCLDLSRLDHKLAKSMVDVDLIVIEGRADSEELAIAYSVLWAAKQKFGRLFEDRVIRKLPDDYTPWLENTCKENNWKEHKEDVISWVELGFKGGPKDLIGGLDTFLEYMYETYKVLRPIKRARAENVAKKTIDQMKFDEYIEKLDSSRPKRYFVITIIGASHKATPTLIYELLRARFCIDQHGTIIHLYDEDERKLEKLKDKVEDLNYMEGLLNARSTIKMFNDLKKALEGVRLLIFLGDESKGKYQKLSRQLRYCYYQYKTLAKTMEPFLNEDVHVVFTCMDYRCFIASVFARFCNSINVYKVVAITSHLALEPTSYMAKATGLPRSHFKYQTSIVWGCVGLSHCVDLANGDVLYNLMRFKNNLPPEDFETMDDITKEFKHEYWGEDNWILRRQDYLVKGLKNTWYYVGRQKEYLFMYMNTKTYISQIKATIDTLESWYDPCPKDNRLSAGINSDGNYGFPLGLFMSQPVYVDKKTREWRVKPNILKSKDLLNLTDLVLFPLSLIRRLVHGHVFQEIIIDQDFLSLVQIGDIVIKQKKEQERLERERLERERLLEEEGLFEEEEGEELEEEEEEEEEEMVNEEFLNVEAEEPSPHETSERQTDFEDESEEGSHEELELEHSRSGSLAPDNDHEEAVEEESHGPNIAPFLDATYINDKGLQYYIGLTEKCEPMLDSELNEEQRALLNLINEFRGKPVKEAFILRKKEVYPPNGVRPFNRRSTADRAKDPAFLVARPVKFIEVPVLSIQWKEIKKVIERLQQLRKKSRKQILEYYANKVMYIFNMKDNKRQINKQNESFNIDPILSDDEQYPEYDITQRVKSTAYMDTSFLFKSDFNIDFQVQDTRPLPKEFTEPQDAYEKRAFISTLQAVEDYAEKVYHKNAKSLHV